MKVTDVLKQKRALKVTYVVTHSGNRCHDICHIAHKDHLGIEPPIIKVQVKSSDSTVTDKDVSALYGKLSAGEYGLFITLGTFSPPSRTFEQSKANLRLIDGNELVDLIFQHYEHFDSRHKGLLPLRRVYVPEVIEEADN